MNHITEIIEPTDEEDTLSFFEKDKKIIERTGRRIIDNKSNIADFALFGFISKTIFAERDILDVPQIWKMLTWIETAINMHPVYKEVIDSVLDVLKEIANTKIANNENAFKNKEELRQWALQNALTDLVNRELETWENFSKEDDEQWAAIHLLETRDALLEEFPAPHDNVIILRFGSQEDIQEELNTKLRPDIANIWHHIVLIYRMMRISNEVRKGLEEGQDDTPESIGYQRKKLVPVNIPTYENPPPRWWLWIINKIPSLARNKDWPWITRIKNPDIYD